MRITTFFIALIFLPQQVAAKSDDYSSSWTPTASNAQMQDYSNNIMASLREEISGMRTHAEHMFGRDIAISLGSSFAMAGISSVAKPWFKTSVGSTVLGLGPTARWAITGAAAGTAVHGLSTGEWFKGNWYFYTAGGAAAGAAVPSVAQAWSRPGSWLSPVKNASDSLKRGIQGIFGGTPGTGVQTSGATVSLDWQLSLSPQLKVTDPGLWGNLGGVARGMTNAGVVTLSSNLFSLAGMKPQTTELLSSFTSGALLGMVGGLNNLTNGLSWYQAGLSGGLTSAASTYATKLATDNLGIKSPALAMLMGNAAGAATNVLVNGAFYSLNGQSIDITSPKIKIGLPADLGAGKNILQAGISTYGKYIWDNSWRNLATSLAGSGLTELIIRNPKLIGLTAEDLQTLPYASAIGSTFQGAFGGLLPGSRLTVTQSIAKGLFTGALTIGEAKIEAHILKHNPKMTPVLASYLIDAGTAAVRGVLESFVSPQVFNNQVFSPASIGGSVWNSISATLSRDGLNVGSFGYLGREQSLLGEISYMHTLTSTFGPRTPEMLKQQMAKNSLSGTTIGDGSTVNLSLSNGTIATLNLIGSSNNIKPFMGTDPRQGLKYTDISGNTWVSNGNGTYSLASENKQDQGSSFIAGWGQLAHDIYQASAVRNIEGSFAAVLPTSARNFLDLPVSFISNYQDQAGKMRTDRFTFASTQDQSGRPARGLTIENRWGNQIYSQMSTPVTKVIQQDKWVLNVVTPPKINPVPQQQPQGLQNKMDDVDLQPRRQESLPPISGFDLLGEIRVETIDDIPTQTALSETNIQPLPLSNSPAVASTRPEDHLTAEMISLSPSSSLRAPQETNTFIPPLFPEPNIGTIPPELTRPYTVYPIVKDNNVKMNPITEATIYKLAYYMKGQLARDPLATFNVVISGKVDATGPDEKNYALRNQYAEAVLIKFLNAGIPAGNLEVNATGTVGNAQSKSGGLNLQVGMGQRLPAPQVNPQEVSFIRKEPSPPPIRTEEIDRDDNVVLGNAAKTNPLVANPASQNDNAGRILERQDPPQLNLSPARASEIKILDPVDTARTKELNYIRENSIFAAGVDYEPWYGARKAVNNFLNPDYSVSNDDPMEKDFYRALRQTPRNSWAKEGEFIGDLGGKKLNFGSGAPEMIENFLDGYYGWEVYRDKGETKYKPDLLTNKEMIDDFIMAHRFPDAIAFSAQRYNLGEGKRRPFDKEFGLDSSTVAYISERGEIIFGPKAFRSADAFIATHIHETKHTSPLQRKIRDNFGILVNLEDLERNAYEHEIAEATKLNLDPKVIQNAKNMLEYYCDPLVGLDRRKETLLIKREINTEKISMLELRREQIRRDTEIPLIEKAKRQVELTEQMFELKKNNLDLINELIRVSEQSLELLRTKRTK